MSALNNGFGLLLASEAASGGYSIDRSVRFNSADSSYLNRTFTTATNAGIYTFSAWVKRSALSDGVFFSGGTGSSVDTNWLGFVSDGLAFSFADGTAYLITTAVYRDPSAWYHILAAVDLTQATASNRVKLYVNGTQITSFSSSTYPNQNGTYYINRANQHTIGARYRSSIDTYFNGYIADAHFVDGQALTPSSFGETDANGVWQPKQYTGTYGNNGFRLPFSNNATSAALGTDASGNNNTWTVNNVVTSNFTIASASGGLPLYNTSDSYGRTRSAGLRTDANASFLSLATALGTEAGLDLTDQNVSGRTSSLKTITGAGTVTSSTSSFNFYGGSARFTGASNSYATVSSSSDFTFGTGDFTIEFWVKSEATDINPGFYRRFITIGPDGTGSVQLGHVVNTTGRVVYYTNGEALTSSSIITNKWTHVALTRASGTVRLFINGTIEASGTDASNKTGNTVSIGCYDNSNDGRMQGDMQDLRIYKGLAKYTAPFTPPSILLATTNDSLVDTPTNGSQTDTGVGGEVVGNYCVLNPLALGSTISLSNGNLDGSQSSTNAGVLGTIGLSSGKWYWEVTVNTRSGGTDCVIGIANTSYTPATAPTTTANSWGYLGSALRGNNASFVSYGATYGAGDVIGVALDLDNGTLTFYKNGVSQGQAYSGLTSGTYFPLVGKNEGGVTWTWSTNFGQRAFFSAAPSGFKALCTANLPTPTITNGSLAMDVKLYTGNGGTQTITGLGFSPDFVWLKARNNTFVNGLFDTVRGASRFLVSNSTIAELVNEVDGYLSAFNSDGFTLSPGSNSSATFNVIGGTQIAWAWDAGASTVTNNSGSRTSQVRANPSAGFSIATWTGSGSGAVTVGHGLGVAPAFYIVKDRSNARNWLVYHTSIGPTGGIEFNLSGGSTTGDSNYWNNTAPTSTVASMGVYVNEAANYVGYFWTPVNGYSAFGSYTGNGSTNGPFVYTGFRPRFLLFKGSSTTETYGSWRIYDTARNTFNVTNSELYPNGNNVEGTTPSGGFDLLSNGFKIRTDFAGGWNTNGVTYIWAAFAENPFKIARAR